MHEPKRQPPPENAPNGEQTAVDAEIMRSAELERVHAEFQREGHEADRRLLEADRIIGEERREAREGRRGEAERFREIAEEARRIAEEAREVAERARRDTLILGEQLRQQDEVMREMRAAMRALTQREDQADR